MTRPNAQPLPASAAHETLPLAVELLGQKLVLWRDGAGVAHAWRDRCPHRGAALSLGQVVRFRSGAAALQCAYHGWCFDAVARCVQVPAQPNWQPPATHSAQVVGCCERFGLIWVNLTADAAISTPLDDLAWPADGALTQALAGPYAVDASAPRLVENFLDMAHFGFVHAGYLGDAAHVQMPAYDVEEHETGVVVPDARVWQPQAFSDDGGSAQGGWVRYRYEVRAPYTVTLEKLGESAHERLCIAMLNCPLDDARTRVWFVIASSGLNQTPEQMIDFQNTIFAQDKPIVESQSPKPLPLDGRELHGPSDRVSAAYRRYLLKTDVRCGVIRP
jgi:phenylpropionate dioxygenase-like ring-hydroxylating dioxygenase large terminal subunit